MPAVVLVLDLGTSSCKGALYTESGECLARAQFSYPIHYPRRGFAEQEPEDYVLAARTVMQELAVTPDAAIRAIGFSTQTPTLVFCDEKGKPLCPAILWQDSRAGEEASWLTARHDEATREDWFGMDLPIAAATTPPKLLWVKRNLLSVWARVRWVMQPKDYVAFKMTGVFGTDRWCAKGLAHLETGDMHPEYLELMGKPHSISPPVFSTRHVLGEVSSADWGVPKGTPVTVGWSDAMAAILATGALHQSERGFVLTGTSEIVGVSRREPLVAQGLFLVPPAILESSGIYLHYGPTQCGGSSLQWMANLLGKPAEEILPDEASLTTVLCRPYWQGERAPYWDHTLTASFDGLLQSHTAKDMVTAVLQGVALQERLLIQLSERGTNATEIVLAGGAARNAAWNQLRADIHQKPLRVMRDTEASLRGAAMLAWNVDDAASWFQADTVEPNPVHAAQAGQLLERFRRRPGH